MRLNARKQAAAPESAAERLRRGRAAAQTLRSAFPQLRQLRLEFSFEAPGAPAPASQAHQLYPPARAFFEFPCPHADCNGQFDLTAIVRNAVANGVHASSGTLACAGSRAFDHSSRQPCRLHLIYAVTALV